MNRTPASNRKHIVLFGDTNAGKSALFNALLGQSRAIVSEIPGTTADPVSKAIELRGYGPVTLVDTAGFNDPGALGARRLEKTRRWLDMADLALHIIDPGQSDTARAKAMEAQFKERQLPYVTVFTKADLYAGAASQVGEPHHLYVSIHDTASVDALRDCIVKILETQTEKEISLTAGLLPADGVAILVVPIDSEAPAGRLILPQNQFIRDCLDQGVRCHVTTDKQLPEALRELSRVDLVVTDSQAFQEVHRLTPPETPLTSFSILMARQKGCFEDLYRDTKHALTLQPGDRVLVAEACTHNAAHEDIGRVKLPRLLEKMAGGALSIDFSAGKEFPDDLTPYQLIVHCGGCMLTPRAFAARQAAARRAGVPFTNYGLLLALGSNILERSAAPVLNMPKTAR